MSDNVKFIFKTLLKVPIIIFVMYFVFNLFVFALTYFRALGVSYVVMQTAVENNYIPEQEMNTLQNYANSLSTEMAPSWRVVGSTVKQQYGKVTTCGVEYTYKVIWPLMPQDQYANEGGQVEGWGGTDTTGGWASENELENRRKDGRHLLEFDIRITYDVPGLKYYADLAY